MYQFIIILDEIKGIRYSQNELNNGNLTAIQLVNYLRKSYLQKNFHTLANCAYSTLYNRVFTNTADVYIPVFICLLVIMPRTNTIIDQ